MLEDFKILNFFTILITWKVHHREIFLGSSFELLNFSRLIMYNSHFHQQIFYSSYITEVKVIPCILSIRWTKFTLLAL
jgi:hypothetical protein